MRTFEIQGFSFSFRHLDCICPVVKGKIPWTGYSFDLQFTGGAFETFHFKTKAEANLVRDDLIQKWNDSCNNPSDSGERRCVVDLGNLKIDVYFHFDKGQDDGAIGAKLDQVLAALTSIGGKEDAMSKELDALAVQVKINTDAEASGVVLIQGIADQLAALKNDPAAIQALSDSLKASADGLSAAIVANTPAA